MSSNRHSKAHGPKADAPHPWGVYFLWIITANSPLGIFRWPFSEDAMLFLCFAKCLIQIMLLSCQMGFMFFHVESRYNSLLLPCISPTWSFVPISPCLHEDPNSLCICLLDTFSVLIVLFTWYLLVNLHTLDQSRREEDPDFEDLRSFYNTGSSL